ncbi:peptidylprolyl isomerase [Sarracenia purpurea var. burkii]
MRESLHSQKTPSKSQEPFCTRSSTRRSRRYSKRRRRCSGPPKSSTSSRTSATGTKSQLRHHPPSSTPPSAVGSPPDGPTTRPIPTVGKLPSPSGFLSPDSSKMEEDFDMLPADGMKEGFEMLEESLILKVDEEKKIENQGLEKRLVKESQDWETLENGDEIEVYTPGILLDGIQFDPDRDKGTLSKFTLGQG